MAQLFFRPKRKEKPRISRDIFEHEGRSLVGVANGKDPYEMIHNSVAIIGGFERLGIKGKIILVKPNVVSGKPNPSTTNHKVVNALVKILYEEGAKEVIVGDMSALLTISTKRNMRSNGILEVAEKAGAQVVVFEDHDWVEVPLSGAHYIERAYVTEWLYKVDLIVNLPVIKTHRSASYSICLKNFIGCTHLKQRPYFIDREHWEEIVAEFNLAYCPHLNIIDGTVSMISGGPWEGVPVETGLIIATGDRVAGDIIGLGIIKSFGKWDMVTDKDVWEQRQIKRALELNIGKDKDNIKLLIGKGDDTFKKRMEIVRGVTGIS